MTDPAHSVPQLEARIAELERAIAHRPRLSRQPRWWRGTRLIAGVLVATMVTAGVAVASHQFSDVPDSYTFHSAIGRMADAGIAAGCTSTTFCPNDAVTRGQMAGFLSRGLGRAARATDFTTFASIVGGAPITEVTIKTGGVSGGTGFVLVTASAMVQGSDAACPCDVSVRLRRGTEYSPDMLATGRTKIPSGWWIGSTAVTWLFEVPSGTTTTIELVSGSVTYSGDPANSFVKGMITAIYVPFGPDGDSVLPASGTTDPAPAAVIAP